MNEVAIDDFWTWFLLVEADLRGNSVDDDMIETLEAHLFRVCVVDWEIGPAREGVTRLSISSHEGDHEGLVAARLLIECAPTLPEWEFSLYKPRRREWNLEFEIVGQEGTRTIDAKQWEFVLYGFDDGTFDVLLRPDESCRDIEKDALSTAAIIIVDGELGEDARRTVIGDIDVVDVWKPAELEGARLLEPGLLDQLISKSRSN
jgi:hypothetical protein